MKPLVRFHRPLQVFGVDYSGAAQAGENAWMATMAVDHDRLRLTNLAPLGRLACDTDRDVVNAYLAASITQSHDALWGMDFPFGLPIELGLGRWRQQLRHVADFHGNAKEYGRHLVDIARSKTDTLHIRRTTDLDTKTPFDCYHYRIIYQTFHGMRDLLRTIASDSTTATVPFQINRLTSGRAMDRCVVEACPSSTLKRLGLPHQRYKQSSGRPPTETHLATRRKIMRVVSRWVDISRHRRNVIMTNPGGDALDAVLAGLGAWQAWQRETIEMIREHPRYRVEGKVFC
ncbi:MAG: DUF429 domain-containing protein [Planctomycetota bacterium]